MFVVDALLAQTILDRIEAARWRCPGNKSCHNLIARASCTFVKFVLVDFPWNSHGFCLSWVHYKRLLCSDLTERCFIVLCVQNGYREGNELREIPKVFFKEIPRIFTIKGSHDVSYFNYLKIKPIDKVYIFRLSGARNDLFPARAWPTVPYDFPVWSTWWFRFRRCFHVKHTWQL